MKTISVAATKGGSGKTTTALNVAINLLKRKNRVLLIDMDYQGSLTKSMGITDPERGVVELYNGDMGSAIYSTDRDGLDIIPYSEQINSLDGKINKKPLSYLKAKLALLADYYDYIVIDTPPSAANLITIYTLVASDMVLVPITTNPMGYISWEQTKAVTEDIKRVNPNLIVKTIGTMYNSRSKVDKEYLFKISQTDSLGVIPYSVKAYSEVGPNHRGKCISEYLPSHGVAIEYKHITDKIIKELKG